MAHVLNVVYPNDPKAKFDLKYYLDKHMPLVGKHWEPIGLKQWQVVQFSDPAAPYRIQAILTFADAASIKKALNELAKEVFDDIQNYTDLKPQAFYGEVLTASS
ncbi:unnamed protein product [Parajaminaea phylloscopi]